MPRAIERLVQWNTLGRSGFSVTDARCLFFQSVGLKALALKFHAIPQKVVQLIKMV